ncbi:MAG: Uncharacterised protein [Opitutia bacterium UBA7350]|nr:MAG: Uncharacterised protein [Opitutae bacterium UBA7350]
MHTKRYVIGLFFVFIFATSQVFADGARPRFAEALKPEEVRPFFESFLNQRLQGDYTFKFLLEHLPRRGRTVRYEGILWGSWNEYGPVTRFAMHPNGAQQKAGRSNDMEWIFQNGRKQKVWSRTKRSDKFVPMESDKLMEPLFKGVLYRPFDLLMPFIHWEDYQYEGSKAVGARLVHQFLMMPPAGYDLPGVHAVRLGLDSEYQALLRIEILDENKKTATQFEVESFKKVQGQYIVKRITLGEKLSGDRTRFRVVSAALNLKLPVQIFEAEENDYAPSFVSEQFNDL